MVKSRNNLPDDYRRPLCAENRRRLTGLLLLLCTLILAGCSAKESPTESQQSETLESSYEINSESASLPLRDSNQESSQGSSQESSQDFSQESSQGLSQGPSLDQPPPSIISEDWSDYFGVLNGAAVLYEPAQNRYQIYGGELASARRSPCSTFKIISSLIALEHGIIDPDHSIRTWSGEQFWNEAWNRDIDFTEAFHTSCVWYFRQVIDEIGPELMQTELDNLYYGNSDISDWEGRLNNNNNNRALTGFWIESSLKISPQEQTEVMERIFGPDSSYQPETLHHLEQAMLVSGKSELPYSIYGKTGMGKTSGVVVDAWFTGFSRRADESVYFCVYLGETAKADVSSTRAKEIAGQILADYWK